MSDMQLAPDGFVWCGKKGDLTLYLTHIRANDDDEPALYIRNENRTVDAFHPVSGEAKPGCPAYLVPLRDFWIFRPEDNDRGGVHRLEDMVGRLSNASAALYGMDVPQYRNRVHDAILEFVDDVKNMEPPKELSKSAWLAQMAAAGITLKVNGQAVN
jgi:hypothetical protein